MQNYVFGFYSDLADQIDAAAKQIAADQSIDKGKRIAAVSALKRVETNIGVTTDVSFHHVYKEFMLSNVLMSRNWSIL
jgi:hypothetical protein